MVQQHFHHTTMAALLYCWGYPFGCIWNKDYDYNIAMYLHLINSMHHCVYFISDYILDNPKDVFQSILLSFGEDYVCLSCLWGEKSDLQKTSCMPIYPSYLN